MCPHNYYLKVLIEKKGYPFISKKEKIKIGNKYCQLTGQNRNYVLRKIRAGAYLKKALAKEKEKERNIMMAMLNLFWLKSEEFLIVLMVRSRSFF